MKMKSVLAAVAAAAVFSCVSVCAFAESAESPAAQEQTDAVNAESETTEDSNVSGGTNTAADPMEGNPVSGVDGLAAVAGIAMVAGAALVISHKHE